MKKRPGAFMGDNPGETMLRRRRRVREIPFSFDSFLDVVANVVGIIIRLILIAWVGARSYSSIQAILKQTTSFSSPGTSSPEPQDPLQAELIQNRQELAKIQARLLEQLRQAQEVQEKTSQAEKELTFLASRRKDLEHQLTSRDKNASWQTGEPLDGVISLAEVQQRRQLLLEEIQTLEKLPPLNKTLRYHSPVSRPVDSEELFFECRQGRVTLIDIGALVAEIRRGMEEKSDLLRTRWQVTEVTRPVGAFRLRYTFEREPSTLEALGGSAAPGTDANFRYGLSEWEVEPMTPLRGETQAEALAERSQFRQIVDFLDPQQAVVTFWVYPDSFGLFRRLRDYLYDRNLVVAGRPLPEGIPIKSSRHGTISRGQ